MTGEIVSGRQPITIIEIDQDLCTRTYGVAPCTAEVGVTGAQKCFNTLVSCQDTANFDLADESPPAGTGRLTLRFCTAMENQPRDVTLFPFVVEVTSTPTEVNLGGADKNVSPLGRRASVTITLSDHPYHDRIVDPYASERTYDAMAQGTFWAKWLRRNPYYQGRALRVLDGYVGQVLGDMRVRRYIIEKIEGPTKAQVKITAKDPIKLLDAKRAQVPFPTSASLAVAMERPDASVQSGAIVSLPIYLQPAGAGDAFVNSDVIRIGSELFRYQNLGSDVLHISQRGLRNTKPAEHKAGDAVQEVYVVENRTADDVIAEMMIDYAGMDPAFIDTAAWGAEAEHWSASLSVSAWITEPTSVAQLVGEIVSQTLCAIWWDEINQEIGFKVLRPRIAGIDVAPVAVNDDAHLIADEVRIEDRPEERISSCRVYYGQIDPTQGNSAANFASLLTVSDDDAESAQQYGERRIDEIFARWLPAGIVGGPLTLAGRKVRQFRDTPKLITFKVDAKDRNISVTDFLAITHHALVDFSGVEEERVIQVTSVDDDDPGHRSTIEARINENDTERYAIVMADGAPDYSAATTEQRRFGWWIGDADGKLSDGTDAYRII